MSLPRMIVRPLNAAKLALSHWTVMRDACDCAASARCVARYSSIDIGRPNDGVVTRAAASGPPVTGGATSARSATRRGAGGGVAAAEGAIGATLLLDHAAKLVRSLPMRMRTWPVARST